MLGQTTSSGQGSPVSEAMQDLCLLLASFLSASNWPFLLLLSVAGAGGSKSPAKAE